MSEIKIVKIVDPSGERLLTGGEDMVPRIERRAYELFLSRGCEPGGELDDWLQAERELCLSPAVEVVEKDKEIRLHVDLSGFKGTGIHVAAAPEAVAVAEEIGNTVQTLRIKMKKAAASGKRASG